MFLSEYTHFFGLPIVLYFFKDLRDVFKSCNNYKHDIFSFTFRQEGAHHEVSAAGRVWKTITTAQWIRSSLDISYFRLCNKLSKHLCFRFVILSTPPICSSFFQFLSILFIGNHSWGDLLMIDSVLSLCVAFCWGSREH